eukprot:1159798-Pelagomonas_calceolata.AAC.14
MHNTVDQQTSTQAHETRLYINETSNEHHPTRGHPVYACVPWSAESVSDVCDARSLVRVTASSGARLVGSWMGLPGACVRMMARMQGGFSFSRPAPRRACLYFGALSGSSPTCCWREGEGKQQDSMAPSNHVPAQSVQRFSIQLPSEKRTCT